MKYQKGIACSLAALLLAVLLPFTAAAAIIGKGNTGTAVEAVQVVLKQEGYLSGACDGIFGSATETALKAYQKAKGLSQDGKAGAKTLAAMGLLSEASSIGEASITEGTVNLRRGPSTSHQVLCNLKRGDKLTVLAVSGSWYQVRTSFDIEGYIYKAYCTANGNLQDPPASAVAATVVNVNTAVNLRKGAGTNTALLGTVAKNAQVWVLGSTGDWYQIRTANGVEGYISKQYLRVTEATASETATVVNVNTAVNMRKGAGTDTAVIAQLKKGSIVNVLGASGSWYKVSTMDGKEGYVSKSYLKLNTEASAPIENGAVITVSSRIGTVQNVSTAVNLRKGAGKDTALLGTVARGKQVAVLGQIGDWFHVQTSDGKQGYISRTYLKVETVQNDVKFESDKSTLYKNPVIGTVVNINSQLKIRAKAGTDSDIKGYLLNQASVTVYGKDGEWYQISTATGIFGYCHEDYIRLTSETSPGTGEIFNPIKGILRSGMNNSDVVAMQKRLKELGYFAASCTGYFGSQTLSAVKAFQSANGLTKDGIAGEKTLAKMFSASAVAKQDGQKEPTEDEKLQAKLKAMVDYAKQYLGRPYVSGGNGPNSFDCSGFTKYVFQNAMGYTLPRTAYTQGYNSFGRKITKISEIKLGDLVFFDTNANDSDLCDHVGIYVGNNQFIHASSGNGMKVVISTLGGTIYERLFSWGKRVFE